MKDKKDITITNVFRKRLEKTARKPNIIWVDKGSEFYNRPMKSRLQGKIKLKSMQHVLKENILLLKHVLKLRKIKLTNVLLQHQKMNILIS